MTRITVALALLQAFLLGVAATVVAVPWLGIGQMADTTVLEEQRFTVDPAWWPKPPRCPPPSMIVEPPTRPL